MLYQGFEKSGDPSPRAVRPLARERAQRLGEGIPTAAAPYRAEGHVPPRKGKLFDARLQCVLWNPNG